MIEVRCCCTPENLLGHISGNDAVRVGLTLRELDDGTHAFSAEQTDVNAIPGFVRNTKRKGGKKTWRKK